MNTNKCEDCFAESWNSIVLQIKLKSVNCYSAPNLNSSFKIAKINIGILAK